MASIVSTLFGNRKPAVRGFASKGSTAQAVLRGASKRAYSFDVHAREAAASLEDVPAVYIYARGLPADASDRAARDAGARFEVGYVGRTENMGRQDAEHERLQHFAGYGFDVVLILRIEQETIRRDIEQDLIDTHNPVLNDLLRGYKRGDVS